MSSRRSSRTEAIGFGVGLGLISWGMADAAKSDPGLLGAPDIGQVLEGRYRLDAQLGEGGVGWVFRATHLKLGSEVAIKMLQERFSESSMMRPRFIREAKALAALKHPHIVTITDFSIWDGRPYIVMELIEGQTLREVITEGPLSAERTRRVAHRILDALAFAHERGFVHRDLKPDNVVLLDLENDKGFPKLLDFGFVKFTDASAPTPSGSTQDVLTRSGIAFGTPAYMSPEQATGGDADERSDIYSLGIMLYEMLTGRRPFEGTLPEIVRAHLTAPIPTFEERGTRARETVELRNIFTKALAKEPELRFQSAGEMRAAIDALPAHFVRYTVQDEEKDPVPEVSVEAPTVAHVPSKRGVKTSGWRMMFAMLFFVGLVGGVAGLVALGAMASQNEANTLMGSQAAETETEPREVEASEEHHDLVTEAVEDSEDEVPIEEVEGPDMEFGEDELGLTEEELAEAERELETEEPAPEPSAEEVDRRHPWQTKRRVNFLNQARRRVLRGRALSAGAERNLKRWVRTHRDDARPHLLIAQSYMAKGWGRSAFDRYQLAQRVDPRSRFDPRMAGDLVRIAAESSVSNAAGQYVVEIYGRDALEPIERELGRATLSDEARARLEALRARINAL